MRLGERVTADFFAARERNEESLFLFFGSEAKQGIAKERILYGKNHARGGTDAGDFLDDDRIADMVHAGAAIVFRHSYAGEA